MGTTEIQEAQNKILYISILERTDKVKTTYGSKGTVRLTVLFLRCENGKYF